MGSYTKKQAAGAMRRGHDCGRSYIFTDANAVVPGARGWRERGAGVKRHRTRAALARRIP